VVSVIRRSSWQLTGLRSATMTMLGPLEVETCRDSDAGWSADQIVEQYPITGGRIIVVRGKHRRMNPLREANRDTCA
jgi:hypothetical protein